MLLTVVALFVVLVLALAGLLSWSYSEAKLGLAGEVNFRNEMAVPPLAESRLDGDGRRVFDLTMQRGETSFGDPTGPRIDTLGINQSYLGPTLRARRGERVRINVTNRIGESSTLHWHGMHLPARMDGGPHQMVADGQTWSPVWRINQPASSLWYHPHPHGRTADHVYRGLAGMFILDDERSTKLALPQEYGVDDFPVIVQDKCFDGDELDDSGSLFSPVGLLGDRILVNGTLAPYLDVTTERVRLRLLNASNARVYSFGLTNGRSFHLVGTDDGLLERPEELSEITLSPGERAEIVVSLEPGERTVLRSSPTPVAGDFLQQRWSGGDDTLDILELRAADELAVSPELPDELVRQPELDPDDVVATRSFELTTPRINGRSMDMDRIDETVTVDTTERWIVRNQDGAPHNFHVHDVQFEVVSVNGAEPPAALRGRKDTVFVPANDTVELLVSFTDYTDPNFPYMFHCHLLRHEDRGMMGQFVVVAAGEQAGVPPGHRTAPSGSHDHH